MTEEVQPKYHVTVIHRQGRTYSFAINGPNANIYDTMTADSIEEAKEKVNKIVREYRARLSIDKAYDPNAESVAYYA